MLLFTCIPEQKKIYMLGSSPMCWLKFGYKNVNSLYFPNSNIILYFKQLFDKFLKYLFCVFMTVGLTNILSNVQYIFFHFFFYVVQS